MRQYQGGFDPMMVSPSMDMRERREDILTPSPKMERVSNKNSEFQYTNYPPNQHGQQSHQGFQFNKPRAH